MGYVVADGKSNWLEGAILICKPFLFRSDSRTSTDANAYEGLYMIIAVCFWFYPGERWWTPGIEACD